MKPSEAVAQAIIEILIPHVRMHYRQTQSSGEYDFELEYKTGICVPFEVTESTDKNAEASRAAIRTLKQGGPFVPRKKSQHDWYVHPLPNARINHIRQHVDTYLAAIEAEGRERFFSFIDASESKAVFAILNELAIEAGSTAKWKSPAIGIALPGHGGRVDPLLINTAVEHEAHKPDNKRKLSSTTALERHLFVYVNPINYLVWAAIRDANPPSIGPTLPPEITHLWLATPVGEHDTYIVWQTQSAQPWVSFGHVSIPKENSSP